MDEVAFKKGYRYITVISDRDGRALALTDDRGKESLASYLRTLTDGQLQVIKTLSMDMSAGYIRAARINLPGVVDKIVFDCFHVVKQLGEVVDKPRQNEHPHLPVESRHQAKGKTAGAPVGDVLAQSVIVVSPQFTLVVYAELSFCSAQDLDLMLVTMTDRELYRLGIIQRVFDRALLQRDAADILELSVRQVQRLVRLYRTDGATAFASSCRGRPANIRINEDIRCKVLYLIRCHYPDFGDPTRE